MIGHVMGILNGELWGSTHYSKTGYIFVNNEDRCTACPLVDLDDRGLPVGLQVMEYWDKTGKVYKYKDGKFVDKHGDILDEIW